MNATSALDRMSAALADPTYTFSREQVLWLISDAERRGRGSWPESPLTAWQREMLTPRPNDYQGGPAPLW